jgi:lipopolysaccharide biosynthesis glycosyltransferase
LDIAFAVDEDYFFHAIVAMESILHHKGDSRLNFWVVVTEQVTSASKQLLSAVVADRAEVRFLDANPYQFSFGRSTHPEVEYVSEAMYLRLQIPDLLPASVSRVLYLDADVLCTSPGLGTLFQIDTYGFPVGAVRDPVTRRMIDYGGIPFLDQYCHIDPQAMYFNSGVLLIDTAAWHECRIRDACSEYLHRTSSVRRFPDQDALNVACYGRWFRLNKRWNHMKADRLDTYRGNRLSDAVLVHLNSTVKPWQPEFPAGHRRNLYERLAKRVASSRAAIEASGNISST